jgi:hypothetical protein
MQAEEMSETLKERARAFLRKTELVEKEHPIFSDRQCHVYKSDVPAMRNCVRYINANCTKHKMPRQNFDFVTPYNNWPLHNKR